MSKIDLDKFKEQSTITLNCSKCDAEVSGCTSTAIAVLCFRCTTLLVPIEEKLKKEPSGFPRGWKLYARFVHADGKVYDKGIEQPKLNGTLKPTDMEEIKKKSAAKKISKKEKLKNNDVKLEKRFAKRKAAKKLANKNKKNKIKELLNV